MSHMLTYVPPSGGDPKHVEKEPLGVVMNLMAQNPRLREQLQLYFAQQSSAGILPEVSHRQNTDMNLTKNDLIFFSERSEKSETSQTMPEIVSNMSLSYDDISDVFFRTKGPGILPISPGKGAFSSSGFTSLAFSPCCVVFE